MEPRCKINERSGVTILEVIVAIFVIMVGLMSALALIISSIAGARMSKNQLIAGNLARQAIEVVRTKRDMNWLAIESNNLDPSQWDLGLYGSGLVYTAIINFDDTNDPPPPEYMEWRILYDQTYQFMPGEPSQLKVYLSDHSGWKIYNQYTQASPPGVVESGFRLAVSTKPICALNNVEQPPPYPMNSTSCEGLMPPQKKIGLQVKATVKWQESGNEKTYEQEERIYNWK